MGSPMPMASRVLIFEPEGDGHQLEWLRHIIRHACDRSTLKALWIVAPRSLSKALLCEQAQAADRRIAILSMSSLEEQRCRHTNIAIGGFWRWWTMRDYLRRTCAEAGHFLQLDHLSLPLAFGLGFDGRPVGGILFRPSVHYARISAYRPTGLERIRDLRKDILYRLMLVNDALVEVLTLDPHFPVFGVERYRMGQKLKVLRDPAPPLHDPLADDEHLACDVPAHRTLFALFGYLTERKGLLTLLEAVRLLPPLRRARAAVLLAGRIDPSIRYDVDRLCAIVTRECPDLWFRIVDRRLTDGELSRLVIDSDVILAPYQRFVGSSGVMLWAARAGRPLLTQEVGLMGRLVRDHGLGVTTNTSDPSTLARAMDGMIARGPATSFDPVAARLFVDQCTPEIFARRVLDSLTGVATPTLVGA